MAALRSINVIQGTPTINAQAMRGLVQSAGHEVWVVESTKTRCIMRGRRAGTQNVQEVVWTEDRAKQLGLVTKDNWRKQPQAMLVARATAEICRWIASDVLIGVPYATEEMLDEGSVAVTDTTPEVKPARRTAQRAARPAPEPAPEPELDEPAEPVEYITPDQQKALHASLRDAGLAEREAGLAAIAAILGRDVDSTKTLTKREASAVIDTLKADQQQPEEPALDELWPEPVEVPQ